MNGVINPHDHHSASEESSDLRQGPSNIMGSAKMKPTVVQKKMDASARPARFLSSRVAKVDRNRISITLPPRDNGATRGRPNVVISTHSLFFLAPGASSRHRDSRRFRRSKPRCPQRQARKGWG